jgi:hypothetical protein
MNQCTTVYKAIILYLFWFEAGTNIQYIQQKPGQSRMITRMILQTKKAENS